MTNNEFNGSDFIVLEDGRTDYSPESDVGLEGTFINPLELQERREAFVDKMSSKLADQALNGMKVDTDN